MVDSTGAPLLKPKRVSNNAAGYFGMLKVMPGSSMKTIGAHRTVTAEF